MKKYRTIIIRVCVLLSTLLFPATTSAQQVIPLWPVRAPGALGTTDADQPSLTVYRPSGNINSTNTLNNTAIIIAPGGAYSFLATNIEGNQVAAWLNKLGITAFVLKYRHGPRYHHPIPLLDAQRAIRLVRASASQYGFAPNRIGIMGFSAGGHLSATAATKFDAGMPAAPDPIDRESSRPDFLILGYPVISFQTSVAGKSPLNAYARSGRNLLGDSPNPQLLNDLSAELHVTHNTPPTFLYHGSADALVAVENSVQFYLALRKAGVLAELHTFEKGGHGGGLNLGHPVLGVWPTMLENWLKNYR